MSEAVVVVEATQGLVTISSVVSAPEAVVASSVTMVRRLEEEAEAEVRTDRTCNTYIFHVYLYLFSAFDTLSAVLKGAM